MSTAYLLAISACEAKNVHCRLFILSPNNLTQLFKFKYYMPKSSTTLTNALQSYFQLLIQFACEYVTPADKCESTQNLVSSNNHTSRSVCLWIFCNKRWNQVSRALNKLQTDFTRNETASFYHPIFTWLIFINSKMNSNDATLFTWDGNVADEFKFKAHF